MSEKLITEMSAEEFAEIIETFITRETQRMGEVDAPLFYEALEAIFAQPDQHQSLRYQRRLLRPN